MSAIPDDGQTPIFAMVLGEDFRGLGSIVRRHYTLRPFSRDAVTVRGTMNEVSHSALGALLVPLARIVGALVPFRGRDVPIEVHYSARPDRPTLHWDRVFRFPGRPPFHFRSHMEISGPGRVTEFVRFGIGLRLRVAAEDGALVFRGDGYAWRILGVEVPLPLGLVLGRAYVEERPLDEHRFTMRMELRHPLLGMLFRYSGTFTIDETSRQMPDR